MADFPLSGVFSWRMRADRIMWHNLGVATKSQDRSTKLSNGEKTVSTEEASTKTWDGSFHAPRLPACKKLGSDITVLHHLLPLLPEHDPAREDVVKLRKIGNLEK